MKALFKLLTLALCLELIVGPCAPQIGLLSIKAVKASTCPDGLKFDSVLNRCLTTDDAAKVMNAVRKCAPDDAACYRRNAEDAFSSSGAPGAVGNKNKFVSSVMSAATIAVPMTLSTIAASSMKSTCTSVSYWGLVGGAVALFVGDLYSNWQHKKRLKKVGGDWNQIIKPDAASEKDKDKIRANATEAQSQAFEMLARSEDSMEATANLKSKFYAIAAAAYATSAIAAGLETLAASASMGASTARDICAVDETPPEKEVAAAQQASLDAKNTLQNEAMKGPNANGSTLAESASNISTTQSTLDQLQGSTLTTVPGSTSVESLGFGLNLPTSAEGAAGAATELSNKNKYQDLPTNTPIVPMLPIKKSKYFDMRPESWDNDILNKKHEQNIASASNLASFFILTQANRHKYSSPSIDEYKSYEVVFDEIDKSTPELLSYFKDFSKIILNNLNPVQPAHASGDAIISMAKGAAISIGVAWGIKKVISKFGINSTGRAIIATVFTSWSMIMHNHANSQAEASANRAQVLRRIKNDFNQASSALNMCSSADRSNLAKPECYCYTPEGQRNTSRTNSQSCQKLWSNKNLSNTNYFGAKAASMTGCIDNNRMHDESCKCKKSPGGCLKMFPNNINMNIGTFKSLSSGFAPVDQVASGNFDAATVDSTGLVSNAMKMLKKSDELMNKKGMEKTRLEHAKGVEALQNGLIAKSAGTVIPGLGSSNQSIPSTPAAAVAALEKELKEAEAPMGNISGGSDSVAQPSSSNEQFNFDFGKDEATAEAQVAEAMKQDLDYGQTDINQGKGANIFEVLSHRYQRSGMRRLFDEEGKTKADAPAQTDITN